MTKILFVCHGNICRSPMAEFVMKDLVRKAGREAEFDSASAATRRERYACCWTTPAIRVPSPTRGTPATLKRPGATSKQGAAHC